MKRLLFPALFAAGFVAAGTFTGVVIADVTTTGATTTAPETTTSATTTAPTTTVVTTTAPTTTTTKAPTTTTTPARPAVIPARVRVAGVRVGGLTPAEAVAAVEGAFEKPLVVVVDRNRFVLSPSRYASPYVATAVARARISAPGTNAHLVVAVRGGAVRAWADDVAHRFARRAVDAELSFAGGQPRVTKERVGRSLSARRLGRGSSPRSRRTRGCPCGWAPIRYARSSPPPRSVR